MASRWADDRFERLQLLTRRFEQRGARAEAEVGLRVVSAPCSGSAGAVRGPARRARSSSLRGRPPTSERIRRRVRPAGYGERRDKAGGPVAQSAAAVDE